MIIIENPDHFDDDITLLKAIGKDNFIFKGETNLEECIYPRDKSISIGRYNGNIIISEDYQITTKTLDKVKDLSLRACLGILFGTEPQIRNINLAIDPKYPRFGILYCSLIILAQAPEKIEASESPFADPAPLHRDEAFCGWRLGGYFGVYLQVVFAGVHEKALISLIHKYLLGFRQQLSLL